MSKKKINNRLDKLFEDIDKEPETKQAKGLEKSSEKANKAHSPAFFISTAGESPNPVPDIDFPALVERKVAPENIIQTPSTMLSTAFRTDEKNWATLRVVDELKHRTWGTEDQMLVKQVADQLSLALENARLFQEAQRRAREMTALADVAREISATLELQQVMERISNQALLILNAVTSAVYIPDPQFQTLIAITATGEHADEIKADPLAMGSGILGSIARSKVAKIINDASDNPNAITIQGTEDRPHEHLMAAPILSQNQLSGLLAVWRVGENEQFSETELEFLASLAQQAAIAVENARLFEETQERAEELSVLNEMARELSAEMNINSIAETAYRYINRLIDTTNFYIALYDEHKNLISFPVFIEEHIRTNVPPRKSENGLTEHVIQSKEPLFLASNVSEHMNSMGLEAILTGNKVSALCWLGVPLLVGNKPIGAMTVQSFDTPDLYSEHDKDLLTTIASQVAIAMENARLLKDAQARARREKILREITARIRATNDPEMIAKTAVRELGQALGVPTFIRLGGNKIVNSQEVETGEVNKNSEKTSEGGM
jgi:GAF domain-containing protein